MPAFLLAASIFGCFATSCLAQTSAIEPLAPRAVTQDRLEAPEPENWLSYRGNYAGWGFSPLDQINSENVGQMRNAWSFSTGVDGGHESPPIVNDGVMYITTPDNFLFALDARTGDLTWMYEHDLPERLVAIHNTNRGVALHGDRVFMATLDARILALDAKTGDKLWDVSVADNATGYYMTTAPLTAEGLVMAGVSGGELGIRGFVVALEAATGEERWRTHTVPAPGEFGSDTWPGETWRTGGAPVWLPGHYDQHSSSRTGVPEIRVLGSGISATETTSIRTPCSRATSPQEKYADTISITGTGPGTGTKSRLRSSST